MLGFLAAGAPKKPPLDAGVTLGATGGDLVIIGDVRFANAFVCLGGCETCACGCEVKLNPENASLKSLNVEF